MPALTWPSKSAPQPLDGKLETESILEPFPSRADQVENRLILGDNLRVMWALLEEWEGKIDLIYADPPFFTNRGYTARIGRGEDSRQPEEWELAEGYQDTWEDLDEYLDMLYPRLILMHRLLSSRGSLYLHLDWHANSYARILLDEIFGYERMNNEIIWTYHGPSPIRSAFNRKHDTLLFYTKDEDYTFDVDRVRVPYKDSTVNTFHSSEKAGFGKMPDLERGKVPEDWWYFPVVARLHNERTGYPTQKPESLLERIILASSNPGDLVADFFGGSGTTASVSARLGRRFLTVDAQRRAVQTARARLVLEAARGQENQEKAFPEPFRVAIQREARAKPVQYTPPPDDFAEQVILKDGKVRLGSELAEGIDYWEVDPDWGGGVFRSRSQAARPWRKGEISPVIHLSEWGDRICVRLVTVGGEYYQVAGALK